MSSSAARAKKASPPRPKLSPPATKARSKAGRRDAQELFNHPAFRPFLAQLTERLSEALVTKIVAELRAQPPEASAPNQAVPRGALRSRYQRNVLAAAPPDPDPLAAARERGRRARDEALREEGGTLSAEEVAHQLGISRQAVNDRRTKGKLLAIKLGKDYRYPAWQFADEGLLHGFEVVLEALAEEPPLAQLRFFLSGSYRLDPQGRKRPLDLLRQGELEPVLRAARTFGEHGAE